MSRRCFLLGGTTLLICFVMPLRSQSVPAWKDPSPHTIRFISVDDNVRLEVLDWGGSGRAVVLLAGGRGPAHVVDHFASKRPVPNRLYGITRRGFRVSAYQQDR